MIRTYEFHVEVPGFISEDKDDAFIDGMIALAREHGLSVDAVESHYSSLKNWDE